MPCRIGKIFVSKSSMPPLLTQRKQMSKRKHAWPSWKKEGNEIEWMKFYFPQYCFKPFATFQIKSIRKFIGKVRFKQWRKWFRGSSKSTIRMMEMFYKMFVKKFRVNGLIISKSNENAVRLLTPYKANLECNQRLINDYGIQEKPGSWAADEFTTRSGHTFRAVGAEQNPRGTRLEELRVTFIQFDDIDDDEVCRNPDRVAQRCEWIERAVIPTVDISGDYLICFDNNLIAEDSCAAWFGQFCDDVDTVNIRDEYGNSTWPEKNSEQDIDDILASISYAAGQAEYFNNPYSEGRVFKEMVYGKCPPLRELSFVVVYADPSPSNKDRPGIKAKVQNSGKAVWIVGWKNNVFYVYKGWLEHTTNSTFIEWLYTARQYVNDKTQAFYYIENNTLQDPFYEQVLMPEIFKKAKELKQPVLGITPDDRKKPDKYFRIEGTLEPLNRMGLLVLNIDEKDNPHMKRLEAQFKSVSPNSKTMDGPDAVEGAVHIIQKKIAVIDAGGIKVYPKPPNRKRY